MLSLVTEMRASFVFEPNQEALLTTSSHQNWSLLFKIFIVCTTHVLHINRWWTFAVYFSLCPHRPSILTAWWLLKPGSAFTPTTPASAAPPAPTPRNPSPAMLERTPAAAAAAAAHAATNHLLRFGRWGKTNQPQPHCWGKICRFICFGPITINVHRHWPNLLQQKCFLALPFGLLIYCSWCTHIYYS